MSLAFAASGATGAAGLRVVRDVAKGTVEVYFDGSEAPVLTAEDKTFASGRVGVGSFDDTAAFEDIVVEGDPAAP